MTRKFKITITRGDAVASHLVTYSENERPLVIKGSGDTGAFVRKDDSQIDFHDVHMDKLAEAVKEQSEECGAEGVIAEVTGRREFQIRLEGKDFKTDYTVIYHPGNAVPAVTSSGGNADIPLPDGTTIPFSKLNPTELKSFMESMAKTNGLNFEFTDLYE
ncbi:MAG: hypothetical protein EOP88_10915 [Verrucomicrobiaceae bacterium]|nr:MAG: hypothetical protein EOP88_10915 [Verrucomicrobiaceae bacterium]